MEAKDLLNLPWLQLEERQWKRLKLLELPDKHFFCSYLTQKELMSFIGENYEKIGLKTGVSALDFYMIERFDKNKKFYAKMIELYTECKLLTYEEACKKFDELKELFRMPSIESDNLEECLTLFNKLSDIEKTMFFVEIAKMPIKMETATNEEKE